MSMAVLAVAAGMCPIWQNQLVLNSLRISQISLNYVPVYISRKPTNSQIQSFTVSASVFHAETKTRQKLQQHERASK